MKRKRKTEEDIRNEIEEEIYDCFNDDCTKLYEHYKKLDAWTLDEGFKLVIDAGELVPEYELSSEESSFEINLIDEYNNFQIFERGIKAGELKIIDFSNEDRQKISDFKKKSKLLSLKLWNECYASLEISPFEFLKFIQKKELFPIPAVLEFNTSIDNGVEQYFWVTESEKISESSQTLPGPGELGNNKSASTARG